MARRTKIEYRQIGQRAGHLCCVIYPPGTWDDKEYMCFLGGCGVATAKTPGEAKVKLALAVEAYLARDIKDAEADAAYQRRTLEKFRRTGLVSI